MMSSTVTPFSRQTGRSAVFSAGTGYSSSELDGINEFALSSISPDECSAHFPDTDLDPRIKKTLYYNQILTGATTYLIVILPYAKSRRIMVYTAAAVGGPYTFLTQILPEEQLSDNFDQDRPISFSLRVISNTVSSGLFTISGQITAVQTPSLIDFRNITDSTMIAYRQNPASGIIGHKLASGLVYVADPPSDNRLTPTDTDAVTTVTEQAYDFQFQYQTGRKDPEFNYPALTSSSGGGIFYTTCNSGGRLPFGLFNRTTIHGNFMVPIKWAGGSFDAPEVLLFVTDMKGQQAYYLPYTIVNPAPSGSSFKLKKELPLPDSDEEDEKLKIKKKEKVGTKEEDRKVQALPTDTVSINANFSIDVVTDTPIISIAINITMPNTGGTIYPLLFDDDGTITRFFSSYVSVKNVTYNADNYSRPVGMLLISGADTKQEIAVTAVSNHEVIPNLSLIKNLKLAFPRINITDLEQARFLLYAKNDLKLSNFYDLSTYKSYQEQGYFKSLCVRDAMVTMSEKWRTGESSSFRSVLRFLKPVAKTGAMLLRPLAHNLLDSGFSGLMGTSSSETKYYSKSGRSSTTVNPGDLDRKIAESDTSIVAPSTIAVSTPLEPDETEVKIKRIPVMERPTVTLGTLVSPKRAYIESMLQRWPQFLDPKVVNAYLTQKESFILPAALSALPVRGSRFALIEDRTGDVVILTTVLSGHPFEYHYTWNGKAYETSRSQPSYTHYSVRNINGEMVDVHIDDLYKDVHPFVLGYMRQTPLIGVNYFTQLEGWEVKETSCFASFVCCIMCMPLGPVYSAAPPATYDMLSTKFGPVTNGTTKLARCKQLGLLLLGCFDEMPISKSGLIFEALNSAVDVVNTDSLSVMYLAARKWLNDNKLVTKRADIDDTKLQELLTKFTELKVTNENLNKMVSKGVKMTPNERLALADYVQAQSNSATATRRAARQRKAMRKKGDGRLITAGTEDVGEYKNITWYSTELENIELLPNEVDLLPEDLEEGVPEHLSRMLANAKLRWMLKYGEIEPIKTTAPKYASKSAKARARKARAKLGDKKNNLQPRVEGLKPLPNYVKPVEPLAKGGPNYKLQQTRVRLSSRAPRVAARPSQSRPMATVVEEGSLPPTTEMPTTTTSEVESGVVTSIGTAGPEEVF